MNISFAKKSVVAGIVVWWCVVTVLSLSGANPLGLLYLLGAPAFLVLPGALTLVVSPVRRIGVWGMVVLAVGMSVLELMSVALIANWLLPIIGISRPLDTLPLLLTLTALVFTLLFYAAKKMGDVVVDVPRYLVAQTKTGLALVGISVFFVAMSIEGAVRLNNGTEGFTTILMLLGVTIVGFFIMYVPSRVEKHVVPVVLYLNALALLFMTSLRGWFISGHDIQREFFVFQLAKNAGVWDVSSYVDAYNACISITILPTLFANVLHLADPYIYKVLFQMVFALVLVLVYLIATTWLSPRLAFLTGFSFMAFPTFFQDMPFLVRQEVAFLFFGLMVYVLFEKNLTISMRRMLFFLFGVGVVLSHYSTTYTVLFVLLVAYVVLTALKVVFRVAHRFIPKRFSNLSTSVFRKRAITLPLLLLLLLVGYLWTSVITNTSEHTQNVVGDVWSAIVGGFEGSEYSPDVFTLFAFGDVAPVYTIENFIEEVSSVRELDPDLYYPEETYSGYSYALVPQERLPKTVFGSFFGLSEIVSASGNILSKLLQLAIGIGLLYALSNRDWVRRFDDEMYALALASVFFVLCCIVVPVLSKEYGVFRAIQQSLFVLVQFMVLGLLVLGRGAAHLTEKWFSFVGLEKREVSDTSALRYAGLFATLFFLFSTGVMGQLVGDNLPAVHLNNQGDDFQHYVITDAEEEAILWLEKRVEQDMSTGAPAPLVQADRFGKKKLQSVLVTPVSGDIFPGSIQKDAYVFVNAGVLEEKVARVAYDGVVLKYTYPVLFLDENKEVVFENSEVRIYK